MIVVGTFRLHDVIGLVTSPYKGNSTGSSTDLVYVEWPEILATPSASTSRRDEVCDQKNLHVDACEKGFYPVLLESMILLSGGSISG